MNFSPFGVGVPLTAALPVTTQYTAGKITQNVTTANGQVVGVLQGGENGVHYIRPLDASAFATSHSPPPNSHAQTVLTLPITMPGAKPGDPQQTVQIQVVNPIVHQQHQQQHSPKFQISQIPIQAFGQGATVLTVAYNSNQEGIQIIDGQNGLPEGMTVVAALQPQDLQILQHQIEPDKITTKDLTLANIKTEMKDNHSSMNNSLGGQSPDQMDDDDGGQLSVATANYIQTTAVVQEYLQRMQNTTLPLSLQQFLKFNTDVKREHHITEDGLIVVEEGMEGEPIYAVAAELEETPPNSLEDGTSTEKAKKKKKYKKKPPKPKKPKPGQVHIATALDGTTLFCCPECHMAYPEKELLEQHLVGHKIERRFICDICGAGLKRKEHLERHKLGHNPERPFVCSVCMKGFKRKEHLNLHFVIHSGEKTEICIECGKGFYRKDHLRKHARSHITRRAKEQQQLLQQQQQHQQQQQQENETIRTIDIKQEPNTTTTQVTIQVPSTQSQIQIPVQIQVPHHLQVTAEGDDESCELLQIPVQIQVPQHHHLLSSDDGGAGDNGVGGSVDHDDHHVPNASLCYDPHLLQSCT